MFYGAGTTENHVHEIGHVGWLTHAGPRFGAANNQAGANFRPTYLSRINYRFGIPSASNWATYWTSLTFSDGDWLFPVSSADGLPEISPIGGADLGVLAVGNPSENVRTNPAGDDMDWDRSGNFNAGGARPFIGQISLTPAGRLSRMHSPRTAQRAVRGVDMAIVNDVLISADTQDIGYARLAGDSDENCERYPILDWRTLEMSSGYEPCFDWDHGELLLEDDGTPIHAESISVARAVLDGTQRLLVVTTSAVDGSTWTEVAVESTPTSLDMSIKSTGTFAPGITLSLDPDDEPELVTLPSGGVVAIFRNAATGALLQSYHAPSLTAAWATPTAFLVDGTPPTYDVVPAATSTDGETYAVGSSGATSTVLRLTSATGGQWVTVESVPASGTPGRDPRGRLELVAAPQVFDPGVTELYMFGRGTVDDDQDLVTFRYTDVSALGTSSWSASQVYWNSKWPPTGAFRVAAIWDDRASVSPETRDLRLLHYTDATCTNDDVCESAFGDGVSCIDKLCEDGTDALLGALRFHPFARGSDPTFYTDYDDWAMMWWGFCEHSQQAETQGWVPSTTDTYRPLPYTGDRRCGPAPWFPEPTPSGMYFLVPAPDDSERTTNPDLYAPSEFVCEL
jgi:hypothetical protein